MTQSPVFEWVCTQVEAATRWSRNEARGTVRLALKETGLDPRTVRQIEMTVVLQTTLPSALAVRRVANGKSLCTRLEANLSTIHFPETVDTPEEIFARLGRTGAGGEDGVEATRRARSEQGTEEHDHSRPAPGFLQARLAPLRHAKRTE